MFTSDNWNTAELAIGEFVDDNAGTCWGIVAKMIVGTLIAGSNLVIESAKKDGGVSVFRVDGDGAALHNATFNLFNGRNTQITLNPFSGFAIGRFPLYSGNDYTINTNNARFWVDTDGNVHIRGTLHGVNGNFTGVVQASDFLDPDGRSMLTAARRFDADFLDLRGITVLDNLGRNSFSVSRTGFVTIGNGSNAITYNNNNGQLSISGNIVMNGGSISWSNVNAPTAAQVGARPDTWNPTASQISGLGSLAMLNNISTTYITDFSVQTQSVAAQTILAAQISASQITAGTLSWERIDKLARDILINNIHDMSWFAGQNATVGTIASNIMIVAMNVMMLRDGLRSLGLFI